MSVSSVGSVSVSFIGQEDTVDNVLREAIRETQQFLNGIEMSLINMAAQLEQDCEYQPMYKDYCSTIDSVDGLVSIMKELKGVSKQLLPKCSGDDKAWKSQFDLDRKREKEMEKTRQSMAMSTIQEEQKYNIRYHSPRTYLF